MSQQTPMTFQLGDEPVMNVDATCSATALHDNAEARLEAARGLLETMANLEGANHLQGYDLANVAQAAQVLATDAADLYRAAHETRPATPRCSRFNART
ncbi:hypothetical protein [Halomonas caseinilytica]|uniref:hypothetical protein n=1 Tax=Halomonas caseinilytica TaxID=438744 RepID=UPI0008486B33|nr:hypothetical protein [Halomonas caseinilytica]